MIIVKKKNIKIIVLLLSISFVLSSCTTINPYTREKQTSKLAIGSGIGAVGGAIIGALTAKNKNRRRNALIGAGIGAIAGGSIGYYMDVQEAKLRKKLQSSGVSVTRIGDKIILNMPGNVTFKTDSSNINSKFYKILNSVAIVLKKYKKTYVNVIGHTDSVGKFDYNQKLSERRARSVGEFLTSRGVLSQRILIAGYGEKQPIASNNISAGRAQNRRVTVELTPITK